MTENNVGRIEQALRHWMVGGVVLVALAVVLIGSVLPALPAVILLELVGADGQENLIVLISAAVFGPYYTGKLLPRLIRNLNRDRASL